MLAPEKFRVLSAECGQEAWNLILESEVPDLVVIDTDLPLNGSIRIDATQLLALMHGRPVWRQIPKIILTSEKSPRVLRLAKDSSIKAVILKPYDPRRFMQEVYNSLSKLLDEHISEVNKQHLELGSLLQEAIRQIEQSSTAGVRQILNLLPSAIEKHFAFEEAFMARHNYPDSLEHNRNHRQLIDRANWLTQQCLQQQSEVNVSEIENLRQELFEDVNDDKRYIAFLHDLRTSLITTSSQNRVNP
jgi:hemerythrin-like metal-binding protein